jgi:hypothetical protein
MRRRTSPAFRQSVSARPTYGDGLFVELRGAGLADARAGGLRVVSRRLLGVWVQPRNALARHLLALHLLALHLLLRVRLRVLLLLLRHHHLQRGRGAA